MNAEDKFNPELLEKLDTSPMEAMNEKFFNPMKEYLLTHIPTDFVKPEQYELFFNAIDNKTLEEDLADIFPNENLTAEIIEKIPDIHQYIRSRTSEEEFIEYVKAKIRVFDFLQEFGDNAFVKSYKVKVYNFNMDRMTATGNVVNT